MWSLGIYSGESTFGFRPLAEACNPVLTRHDVRDVPAAFVADPFMISSEGVWYIFFDVCQVVDGSRVSMGSLNRQVSECD